MTPQEIEALAARIAQLLADRAWVPETVRPEPPGPPSAGSLPTWAGAAQQLSDVAPVTGRKTRSGRHRPAYDALTAAARGAAAGRAAAPLPAGPDRPHEAGLPGRSLSIGVSNRHIHISLEDLERLFGPGSRLTPERSITQPGQFAARERVRVTGPKGSIDGVRIVGPARPRTQVELASSDCRLLGVSAPTRASGSTEGSAPIRLEGPEGSIELPEGAIIAARHVHLSPADATRFGLADGDRVMVTLGRGDRRGTLPDVLVRAGEKHATELHLDTDEAHAFGVTTGDVAILVGRPKRGRAAPDRSARRLVTERDVSRLAAEGQTLSDSGPYIVTPSARDRAKALGIWRPGR